jgi:hypothetical protein
MCKSRATIRRIFFHKHFRLYEQVLNGSIQTQNSAKPPKLPNNRASFASEMTENA